MFDPVAIFKKRLKEHLTLMNRYLRYIFNGHFMIALLFFMVTLSIYYQKWLEGVDDQFPASIVIGLIFGVVASYNPIQTLLKEPDKVFLIVKEEQMHRYFRLALLYNIVIQLYIVIAAVAIVTPLYKQVVDEKSNAPFLFLIFLLLLVKIWNMVTDWNMMKVRNKKNRVVDLIIRTLLSIGLFSTLLEDRYFMIVCVLYFGVVIYDYLLSKKQSGLAWDILIENDEYRLASFYRFVSMFAEVPHVKKRLKRRNVLTSMVHRIVPFAHQSTFDYLYRLTFIRSGDYFQMFVRLTIIGSVILYFVPNEWVKIVFAILFLYATSFQMTTLYRHYRTNLWLDIYPLETIQRKNAFLVFSIQLTWIQLIIFSIVLLFTVDWRYFLIALVASVLFNYAFHYGYVKKKI